jgi:glucan phosphoethanolaminetransferase (alkaline phosphatase superfamily)
MPDETQTPPTTSETSAAASATPSPEWVDRGRAILRVAVWVSAGLSVLATIALIVLGALGLSVADSAADGAAEALTWMTIAGGPVLFVIAMNLLVWRALLRGLARRRRGEAIAVVVVISLALAVASMLAVATLLFFGFLASAGGVFGG